jgi:3-hydroxyacyl-[acyl-carrier-protein] dehydratase
MNREEIKKILPHREPMLLIDEVALEGGVAVAKYTVRGDEFFLQGHFPGNPVVPGVILCEMMAQSACILIEAGKNYTPYYTGMTNVRFKRKVLPGETIEFKSELVRAKAPFYFMKSEGFVGGKLAVCGEFSFAAIAGE